MDGPGDKKQLGRILLRQKLVTSAELDELLAKHRGAPGSRLGSVAVESGKVDEGDMLRALSEQHGLPGIDLAQTVIPLENLRLIPHDIAQQYLILPFSVKDQHLFLAMAEPSDKRVIDEIEFVTGRKVFPYVAISRALEHVIDEAYRCLELGEEFYVGPHAPEEYLQELGLGPSAPATASEVSVLRSPPAHEPPAFNPVFSASVASVPSESAAAASRARGSPLVLVVDDEDDIRRMLRKVLSERDITVVEAVSGSEALTAVHQHEPDLILLDAMLPELHGLDVCRRIKGSPQYADIPIIMISAVYRGWRVAEDLKQSYGVHDFLEKPFKVSDVVLAVERALDGKSPDDPNEVLSEEASECLQRGIESYRAGDLDVAIEHLERGLELDPLAFRLHYHLGLLYGRRDQIFEGIQSLEMSVDLAPRNFTALKNLAVLYQRAGFKHKAIEAWERALGRAPDEETRRGIKDHLMSLL